MEFRGFRGPHRAYGPTCKVSADLVVHGVRKSTFLHFPVNWHFEVVEMVLKTLHIVPGLSRTPLLFIPRYLTNLFFESISQQKISIIELLVIWNFKNPGSLTSAQSNFLCQLASAIVSSNVHASSFNVHWRLLLCIFWCLLRFVDLC